MALLPFLENKTLVIIVDAVKSGHDPGTVTRTKNVPAFFQCRTSPHQVGLADVLALSALSADTPPETLLFGIEPADMGTGIGLSGPVASRISYLVDCIAKELEARGVKLTPQNA